MKIFDSPDLLEQEIIEVILKEEAIKALILYNDDFNTFDHVIECLVTICNHDVIQAEQCAYLVHHTGKCVVKQGTYDDLKPMKEGLIDKGLSAVLEK